MSRQLGLCGIAQERDGKHELKPWEVEWTILDDFLSRVQGKN